MLDQLQSQIIKTIYFAGAQSIAEISMAIGKSIPIITKSIQKLVVKNIIISDGLRASTGGRRAAVYSINKDKIGNILTINMDRYSTTIALYNLLNKPISKSVKLITAYLDDEEIYASILKEAKKIVETHNKFPIFAIGITAPGFVDSYSGINNSYSKESPLYNIAERLQNELNINTYIENDSSAIAIAEQKFGQVRHTNHALVINLTWGVGLGIIVDNQLFRGFNGFAGEFSHIPLADENKLCHSCGKKGCLEVEASLESAIEYIKECLDKGEASLLSTHADREDRTELLDALIQAYKHGDQLSIRAIKKMGFMLGKGIATLIHILNPEKVIISGIGAIFGDILLPEIQSSIHIYCIPRLAKRTTIQISNLENM